MLRVVAHSSAAAAQKYFSEGLKREDYYLDGQEVVGKWHGKAAGMLGLSGAVTKDAFSALVENRHPGTGEKLTQRNRAGRRVGYDLTFNAPKSLSVLYAITQDPKVLEVFRRSVSNTMGELERLAETRVRKGKGQGNRVTGNLAWAEFVHFTSRPVGGVPDPHLHIHCFTFNATFDGVEDRWKAGEFAAIKRGAEYAQAAFHSRLTAGLNQLGYGIQRKRGGWEIAGMPPTVIAKFSRRTAQIEALAAQMGITDAKAKDGLGALSREGKRKGLTFPDLLALWGQRLTDDEKAGLSRMCFNRQTEGRRSLTPKEAVDYAIQNAFERQSVARRDKILADALTFAYGDTTPEAIKAEFVSRKLIGRKVDGEHICTTIEVLAEEVALINFVRSGRGTAPALGGRKLPTIPDYFSEDQRAAVRHALTSRDQVIAIKGGAGVGKTTLMQVVVPAAERRGLNVFAFAPSASASRQTLREEGFAGADTIAQLLINPKLQQQIKGQIIWIDEAGLVGVRDLWRIMEIAGAKSRIFLTGDYDQHSPVPRGDPFRLISRYSGLRVARVTQIQRQELEDYKKAIEALSKGDLRTAFRRLDALGAFVEVADEEERYQQLAADYVALGGKKMQFPLVVSPTHAEGAKVTEAIRQARNEAGQLGPQQVFAQFHNLQWTETERALPENYREGLLVQFHQNAKGFGRGELLRVTGIRDSGALEVKGSKGNIQLLDLKHASRFTVFEERQIQLAKGDLVKITRGGDSLNGKRLNNGDLFSIRGFSRKGDIELSNGAVLAKSHGHVTYGYCQTSHSSQSRSVQHVLVAQSENSGLAASREQFYVSCSRGKQTIRIYTDNRDALLAAVGNSSARVAGVELAGLTQADIADFMQKELGARQWREAVGSRRSLDQSKTFVEHLVEQRKMGSVKKHEALDWRGYIEMRRGLISADGKNRSKGHPAGQGKGKPGEKGRSWPKVSQHSEKLVQQFKAASEAKKADPAKAPEPAKAQTKKNLLQKAHDGAAGHFKKLVGKVKGRQNVSAQNQKPPSQRSIRIGNVQITVSKVANGKRAGEHAKRQRAQAAQPKAQTKQQIKAPVQAPPRRK
ncbi:MAG TPA: MobF family relaxase [Prosthecobacter sp.]